MNALDENNLSTITAYLTDDTIKKLGHSNKGLHNRTKRVKLNPLFWKEHFEVELGKTVPNRTDIDWKRIYFNLLHTKRGSK